MLINRIDIRNQTYDFTIQNFQKIDYVHNFDIIYELVK